jgi:hypothetical protein
MSLWHSVGVAKRYRGCHRGRVAWRQSADSSWVCRCSCSQPSAATLEARLSAELWKAVCHVTNSNFCLRIQGGIFAEHSSNLAWNCILHRCISLDTNTTLLIATVIPTDIYPLISPITNRVRAQLSLASLAWEDIVSSGLLIMTQDWTAGLQHTASVLLLASYSLRRWRSNDLLITLVTQAWTTKAPRSGRRLSKGNDEQPYPFPRLRRFIWAVGSIRWHQSTTDTDG